jgi:CubicO group peptidase (beta-lactamase class C family)
MLNATRFLLTVITIPFLSSCATQNINDTPKSLNVTDQSATHAIPAGATGPAPYAGGFAQLKNNKVFLPSDAPLQLENKVLSESDRDIRALADQIVDANATLSLLLIEKGKIVFEKYKAPATSDTPLFSMSMSKSLTAYTIGNLLCSGKIKSLEDRADSYAPELKGTVFGESRIKDLLTMSSGARDGITSGQIYPGEFRDTVFNGVATVDILKKYGQRDKTLFGSPLAGGAEFRYKNVDTYALEHVADSAGGFFDTFQNTIWKASRSEGKGYWLHDSTRHAQAASGASFIARDWARLALYSLNQLKFGSPCMQDFMRSAASKQLPNSNQKVGQAFAGYGYQTFIANFLGKNSYWWVGYGGQRVGIDPESEKIIVLTSYREDYMEKIYRLFTLWQNKN